MDILLVSQYFRPEAGATQNRMTSFVDGLIERGHSVTVLCEQPNHPEGVFHPGFGRRTVLTERGAGLTVHRLWVAASPLKTSARRLAFYSTFAAGAAAAVGLLAGRHDVLFVTSPPVPGSLAVAAAARLRRLPYVLDVRDLTVKAAHALGELNNERAIRALERAERSVYQHAVAVTATTRPFCTHIDAVAGRPVSVHVPNGALDQLIATPPSAPPTGSFVVGYAGNLGIAQGLDIVFEAAARLRNENIGFVLVGGGPLEAELRQQCASLGLTNVEFRPGVPVDEVASVLQAFHVILVPLRAHAVLEDFVPSKLYDAMAIGRPAIVAAAGEAAALADETGCGLVIAPQDGAALADAARLLRDDPALAAKIAERGRRAAPAYARSRQLERLEAILEGAASHPQRS